MNNEEEVHKAEIIYIDATEDEEVGEKGYEQQRYWSAMGDLKSAKFPVGLRILGLIVGLLMSAVAAIMLIATLFWLAISLVTFRQSPVFNKQVSTVWKATCKTTMLAFGGYLAVFNPALGIGLVMLYFMMKGEEMNEMMFNRFSSYNPHQN